MFRHVFQAYGPIVGCHRGVEQAIDIRTRKSETHRYASGHVMGGAYWAVLGENSRKIPRALQDRGIPCEQFSHVFGNVLCVRLCLLPFRVSTVEC